MVDAHGHAVDRPLQGCRVLVTRERPGELGRLLAAAGATLVHVPLIEVVDPPDDDRAALAAALASRPDWVMVTSVAGVERIAPLVSGVASVKIGAVGTATARSVELFVGRPPDLVPDRQLGAELARQLSARCDEPQAIVVAQAEAANPGLVDGLTSDGHQVQAITAYRTLPRVPSDEELSGVSQVDAVSFASGSAATAWAEAFGDDAAARLPAIVAVIGPTTAAATWNAGLKVTDIAADYSMAGLVDAVARAWRMEHR